MAGQNTRSTDQLRVMSSVRAASISGRHGGTTCPAVDDPKTTVFAPTNDAFEAAFVALGVTAEQVLADTELLTTILTYHVVEGEVMSADIEPGDVPTVEGEDLTIEVTGGAVTVNGATVEAADVEASNGVIHVIDEVLVPPNVDVASLTG